MRRGDGVTPCYVGNGAGGFEDATKRPRGKLQLLRCGAHERLAGGVELAKDATIGGP